MRFYSSILLLSASASAATLPPDVDFRWSSTGGGWRAMFACVGFANVFQKAGLFTEDSSLFSSISTTSGASWFSTQLFYSSAFYNQTVMAEDPSDLYDFVITWMAAYYGIAADMMVLNIDNEMNMDMADLTTGNEDNASLLATILDLFDLISMYDGDWASFVQSMLEAAAEAYGHVGGNLSAIEAIPENRLTPLQNTDLIIQAGLVPNSRIRLASADTRRKLYVGRSIGRTVDAIASFINSALFEEDQDMAVYVGPPPPEPSADGLLYTTAFSAAYVVNSTSNGFHYGTYDSNSQGTDLVTYVAPTPTEFEFDTWRDFHLFPLDAREETMSKVPARNIVGMDGEPMSGQGSANNNETMMMMETGTMPKPFGGKPATVIQLAAVSSAVAGAFSPSVPSLFSQALSLQRELVREERGFLALPAFDLAVNNVYESVLVDDAAVCSQWPSKCDANDGRFVDGVYIDNPAVAVNIASYQKSTGANLNTTIKLVLTNTNQDVNTTQQRAQILQYFQTDFNENVPPGGYIWLPAWWSPTRSPQVFVNTMTSEQLDALLEPIEGSLMTTAVLKGTTMDNPSFGVKAGQNVEILLINTNADIPTMIATPDVIQDETIPLAAMAQNIAANQELVQRVRDFFFGSEDNADNQSGEDSVAFTEVTRGNTNLQQATLEDEGSEGSAVDESVSAAGLTAVSVQLLFIIGAFWTAVLTMY